MVVGVVNVEDGGGVWVDVLPPRGDKTLESLVSLDWLSASDTISPPRNRYARSVSLCCRRWVPFRVVSSELRKKARLSSLSESRWEASTRLGCWDGVEWSLRDGCRRSNGLAAFVHDDIYRKSNTNNCRLYAMLDCPEFDIFLFCSVQLYLSTLGVIL